MGKIRGFLVKNRISTLFRRMFRRHRWPVAYHWLYPPKPASTLSSWTHRLRTKAKTICSKAHFQGLGRRYARLGQEPAEETLAAVPKGYMAVYVGQKDGDFKRVLVPVIYFNDPLFGQLLRDVEKEFGFNHPGAITIPCRISEFERVQTRIKEGRCRKRLTRK